MAIEVDAALNDFYLSPKELADLFGVSAQAVHKDLKKHNKRIQYGAKAKIYPEVVRWFFEKRGGAIEGQRRLTFHTVKGGPGKTTLTHLFATRLSALGFKTLVIDLDKQANLTNAFGIDDEDPDSNIRTLMDVYNVVYKKDEKKSGRVDWASTIIEITDFLHLLPASIEMANLDLALSQGSPNLPKLFQKLLKDSGDYDLIVLDLPPDFNRVTIAAHCFSDTVFIPINMSQFSLKGLTATLDHLDFIENEHFMKPKRVIVPNKMDARYTSSYEIMEALNKQYGDMLAASLVPVSKPLEDSYLRHKCVWQVSRAKPCLEAIETIISHEFGLDSWKNRKLTLSRNREVEANA